MSDSLIKATNDTEFANLLENADTPILVDFWAPWCGPCKALAPILEDVAPEYHGKLAIYKMNVDENQETPGKFGIRGIPAMLIFKNGEVAGTKVGLVTAEELKVFINETI